MFTTLYPQGANRKLLFGQSGEGDGVSNGGWAAGLMQTSNPLEESEYFYI